MPTTIESLELEVQSSSTSATSGIDALSASLSKLKNAVKGGVGLTSVTNQLKGLNAALQGIDSSSAGKLDTLSNGLSKLSGLGNIKISSSIGNQLQSIGTAATSLNGVDFSGISRLASSLQPLTTLGKSNLAPFITQLGKLPQLAQTLNTMNIPQFASQLNQLSSALAPLASQLNTVSTAFSRLPANIRSTVTATNAMATANNNAAKSYVNLWAKLRMAKIAVLGITRVIASWLTESNEYIETMNLFSVSMGEYAEEASQYAEKVGELMGIDPSEWMRNQGSFMTIIKGFGVAGDKANMMSRNLTQLGYDLASFENRSFEEAMVKIQSGIAGELEPLRRWGYDLSVARLQQDALTLGIEKSVSQMTQAEKAELRYYEMMTQVTWAQEDMARTLDAPANQLRILQAQLQQCARAMGDLFLPILQKVLPYLIAFAKFLREIIVLFASMFNISLPEFDYSSLSAGSSAIGDLADNADNASGGLGKAAKEAKKLKNALLGIDELNVISPEDDSSSGGSRGSGLVGGGDLGIELPDNDKWLEGITSKVDDLVKKFKEWAGLTDDIDTWADLFDSRLGKILLTVGAIGVGLAAWKIAKGIIAFLDQLEGFKGFGAGVGLLGFLALISDLNEFVKYFQDFAENDATFQNVVGMISEFAGAIGDCAIILGNIKLGAALKVVQGVGEIIIAVKDIAESGVNWENASTAIRGLSNIGIAIGLLTMKTGGLKLAGWSLVAQGISGVIGEIGNIMTAIRTGDWSGVDKVTLVISALEIIGGLALALDWFSKLKGVLGIGKSAEAVKTVSDATGNLSNTVSTSLSPNLTTLAKNLGMGLVIVAEVAAAALLITGAIILLGMELEQVGIAWQPVIDNGKTVAIAMGIGVGILATIGVVTALLGSVGTPLIVNIALGVAILAELGVAAGLFLVEIWAIGKGLDEIGKAWQPVLDNGETIAKGIGLGTALLVGIGAVTALLGAATIATGALLPIAIGLGTALLVELAAAFILFTESLVAVADELSNNLSPSLTKLNGKLPTLSTNMGNFVDFMTEFSGQVVKYTEVSAIAGLSATIDKIIGWFTEDPIDKLAGDVNDIYNQTTTLNEKLNLAVPELKTAVNLLGQYVTFVDELGKVAGSGGTVNLSEGLKTNLKTVGENIVTGFNEGVKNKYSLVQTTMTNWGKDALKWFNDSSFGGVNKEKFATYANDIVNGFKDKISSSSGNTKSSITTWATNIKTWFTSSSYGAINSTTFEGYAKNVVTGFRNGITSNYPTSKSGVTTWADYIKKWFSDVSYGNVSKTQWETYAKNVVTGFSSGITSNYSTAKSSMTTFANSVKSWFEKPDGSNTLSSQFYNIGENIIQGFINGVNSLWDEAMTRMNEFGKEVIKKGKKGTQERSPSKAFKQIGAFVIEGFNIGLKDTMGSSFSLMDTWTNGITAYSPTVGLSVDTSALKYYDSADYARTISANVSANSNNQLFVDESTMKEVMKEAVLQALNDSNLATDMRRQADKEEQTIVQVGNRTVTDAVTTQKKANGYVFAT